MNASLRFALIPGLVTLFALSACVNEDLSSPEDLLRNNYTVNWIKKFGLIDPEQDWNMATRITAEIDPATFGEGFVVNVYNTDPIMGGVLIAQVSTPMTLDLDVAKDAESVFVRAYTPDFSEYMATAYPIVNGKIDIRAKSRAALPLSREDGETVADPETDRYMWILACEDLGSIDDYDFNDIVLGINYVAGDANQNKLIITPLAAGGVLKAYVYYDSENDDKDGEVEEEDKLFEIHNQLNGQSESTKTGSYRMYNTTSWGKAGTPRIIENVKNFSITDNMGGIKIEVIKSESSKENATKIIQVPATGTAPQIICVNGDWEWPQERVSIQDAYPDFTVWNRNAYTTEWTNAKVEGKILKRTTNYPFTTNHAAVDLGLSVKWATCNIGAEEPKKNGYYFAWGETTTKNQNTYYSEGNSLWYGWDYSDLKTNEVINGSGDLYPHYDAATVIWGGSWRMPTYEEIKELIKDCVWTWNGEQETDSEGHIISYGYYTITGNGNSITLPAAGCKISSSDNTYNYYTFNGYYWSATVVEDSYDNSYGLAFSNASSSQSIQYTLPRYYGFPIRPVTP